MPERLEDTVLLAALAEALSGDTPAPPPEGLAALHAAVDRRAMGQLLPERSGPSEWFRGQVASLRWRRPIGVAAIVAGTLVTGGGVAFAAGAPVPPAIRELATHLGLPVTPQPVVNVHNTESSLTKALQQAPSGGAGTTGTANSAISHYAGTLRHQVSQLTPAQQRDETPRANDLLNRASRQDEQGHNSDSQGRSNHQRGSAPNQGTEHRQSGNQNNPGNQPGSQHNSTGGTHSGSSRSGGDGSPQGDGGGSIGFRYFSPHVSTTTSVLGHQREGGDNG